jgi:hypothetical protein
VKGISARAIGVGSVRIIVNADDEEEIPVMLKKVLHICRMSYPVARRGRIIGFSASLKLGDTVTMWC